MCREHKRLLNVTDDLEEARYGISTKWEGGEDGNERKGEAEEVGGEMRSYSKDRSHST